MALHYDFLSSKDKKQIDAIKESYGGAKELIATVEKMRRYDVRKKVAEEKGFGEVLAQAEEYAKSFAKVENFIEKENIKVTKKGVATTQVSGFQGALPTLQAMKKMAEDKSTLVPKEMISVMALDEDYVLNGELLTTLAMCENIMGAKKYCNTNLVGTPLSNECYANLESITGEKFDTASPTPGMRALTLKNMGTAFGNLGGVEVANNNHLVYLDGIARAAVNTGSDFFLNPSWSTIVSGCYFLQDVKNVQFKISMLLSTQNPVMFRMLLNIMKEYIRDDGTSAIYEINLGNGILPDKFIQCSQELEASGIKGVSLAAHLRINPDLGMADFDWTDYAHQVLDSGTNMTIKYESDGTSRPLDTMATYFLPKDERLKIANDIGDVIYYKCVRCSEDAKEIMRRGHESTFAKISYQ